MAKMNDLDESLLCGNRLRLAIDITVKTSY